MRVVLTLLGFIAIFDLILATRKSLQIPNISFVQKNQNGNIWSPPHHKHRFSDPNFDSDSLTDAETENASKLDDDNLPLLQNPTVNEEEAEKQYEQHFSNLNKHKENKRRKNDLKMKMADNQGLPVRRRKELLEAKEEEERDENLEKSKFSFNKALALSIIFLLTFNPSILLMVFPSIQGNNNDQSERSIISLNSLTKCHPLESNPSHSLCKIEMSDTSFNQKFEIYAKNAQDKDHLSLVTQIDPNECKLGKNVVIDKWHTGEALARCEKHVKGIIDDSTKIKLNSQEADKVQKYELESVYRRSLTNPENEFLARIKEDIERQNLFDKFRSYSKHSSFASLHRDVNNRVSKY